ncbi:MAG: dihydropteroate synthase [Moorea sp. SIO4A3]|nr:dihydropteroate synthase [Moorena sp. SIO4A3]
MDKGKLTIQNYSFEWGKRTYIMGILNVTPDSFSDGGEYYTPEAALKQAQALVDAGADIIDIGGQSTRPGAEQISLPEELKRVVPVVKAIRSVVKIPISVDTTRVSVAKAAVEAGADIVNDISGGTFDPDMLPIVAQLGVPIVLMHIRGTPVSMQKLTDYQDLIGEIYSFLEEQVNTAIAAGIKRSHIIIDPGIGFAKTAEQSVEILRQLPSFDALGVPMLVGVSRKSFIGRIINQPDPKGRIWGTAAACCSAIAGSADILRLHDVRQLHDVCRVADAIWRV